MFCVYFLISSVYSDIFQISIRMLRGVQFSACTIYHGICLTIYFYIKMSNTHISSSHRLCAHCVTIIITGRLLSDPRPDTQYHTIMQLRRADSARVAVVSSGAMNALCELSSVRSVAPRSPPPYRERVGQSSRRLSCCRCIHSATLRHHTHCTQLIESARLNRPMLVVARTCYNHINMNLHNAHHLAHDGRHIGPSYELYVVQHLSHSLHSSFMCIISYLYILYGAAARALETHAFSRLLGACKLKTAQHKTNRVHSGASNLRACSSLRMREYREIVKPPLNAIIPWVYIICVSQVSLRSRALMRFSENFVHQKLTPAHKPLPLPTPPPSLISMRSSWLCCTKHIKFAHNRPQAGSRQTRLCTAFRRKPINVR